MLRIGIGLAAIALAAQAQTADGWNTVGDRRGATIQVPKAWKAAMDADSTKISVTGPGGERMVLWPVFVGEALNAQTASAMLARVAPKLDPSMAWTAAAPAGPAAVRMAGKSNGQAGMCSLTWVNSPRGAAAYFVSTAAPQWLYPVSIPMFARIYDSLKLSAPAEGAALQTVRWSDPKEQAFSVELPANWRIEGGTLRRAAVDLVHSFAATAPDGSARLAGGDPEIPVFAIPNQTLAWTGFREGSWYSPGYGVRMMVRQYMPGLAFARWYVQTRVAQGCANLQFTQGQDRTRDLAAINAQYAQLGSVGMNMQVAAGDVSFTCQRGAQQMTGYYFASTLVTQTQGNGIWAVDQLYGYVSQAAAEPEAQTALAHGLESFQWNPQWVQMQQGVAMQTSAIVHQTQVAVSGMIKSTHENKSRVDSEVSRKRSNAMLGVLDARDPATGRELKVDNAANFHWIDNSGRIIGTQTNTRPAGVDARLLVTLP